MVAPVFHKYEFPGEEVRVVEPPRNIVVVPEILAVGAEPTITVVEAVDVHPPKFVTVTVYEVLLAGPTVIACVVAPVFHKYEFPAEDVSVVEPPVQMEVVPEILAAGADPTVTVAEVLDVHPPE